MLRNNLSSFPSGNLYQDFFFVLHMILNELQGKYYFMVVAHMYIVCFLYLNSKFFSFLVGPLSMDREP
jgi:hypothetical protein